MQTCPHRCNLQLILFTCKSRWILIACSRVWLTALLMKRESSCAQRQPVCLLNWSRWSFVRCEKPVLFIVRVLSVLEMHVLYMLNYYLRFCFNFSKKPITGSEDSWDVQYPGSVMQFLCLVHSNFPRDALWASPDFLNSLASAVFPTEITEVKHTGPVPSMLFAHWIKMRLKKRCTEVM